MKWRIYLFPFVMIIILYGNSLRGAHVRWNLYYSTWLRHLIRPKAVPTRIFLSEKTYFLHACATCSELPSYISIMPFSIKSRKFKVCVTLTKTITLWYTFLHSFAPLRFPFHSLILFVFWYSRSGEGILKLCHNGANNLYSSTIPFIYFYIVRLYHCLYEWSP